MSFKAILAGATATAAILTAGAAFASPSNVGEPAGPVLHDYAGSAIPTGGYQTYTLHFTTGAGTTSTDLGFAFREDPAYLFLDNVSLTDDAGGGNLVTNGDFEAGTVNSSPVGWTYQNPQGASFAGFVQAGSGVGGSNAWYDGSVQAYDTIFQNIGTVGGDAYTLTFALFDNGGGGLFQALSTNGDVTDFNGNGRNLVVYAGQGRPVLQGAAPEPGAWALMLLGFGGIGATLRSRRKAICA